MALIESCCRCLSLRRGTCLCGIYCLVYFLIFAYLSGPNVVYETILRFDTESWKVWAGMGYNETFNESSPDEEFSQVVSSGDSGLSPSDLTDDNFGNPIVYVLSVVDFVSETCGCISSVFLIIGVFLDRVSFLVPWLIVVPLHTIIDTFMVIFIVIEHVEEKADDPWEVAMRNIPLLLIDVTLNLLNIYMILCVLSQYQEYQVGRGTAAYEAYIRRQYKNEGRERCLRTTHATNRHGPGSSNHHPSSQKSDIWLEELVLEKLEGAVGGDDLSVKLKENPDKSLESSSRSGTGKEEDRNKLYGHGNNLKRYKETLRSDSTGTSNSTFLSPDYSHGNPTSSPSMLSTYSSIGMEESTGETMAEF